VPDQASSTDVPQYREPIPESVPGELLRTLAVFAEPPGPEHAMLAEVLGLSSTPTAVDYSDVFLFQLYPYASVYLGPEGMMGGDAAEKVAGFWSALGYVPPAEPDHLASLMALYVTLSEREEALDSAERALGRQARRALLAEHLGPWVFAFLGRVQELTAGPYAGWSKLLEEALTAEWVALKCGEDTALSSHLQAAPPLPDPRAEGGAAFLSGLLAPVRTGVMLTRADLGRIARDLDLGLRAGERRYALEHLLAQDASAVLRALSNEARRQGEGHQRRVPWLGAAAEFAFRRAESTSILLDELISQSDSLLEPAADDLTVEAAP
jgi:TorA maturation chaperone TorD